MGLMLDIPKDGSGPKTIDLTPAVVEFQTQVKSWMLREDSMEVRVRFTRRTDLPSFVFDEGERPKFKRKRKSAGAPSQVTDMSSSDDTAAVAESPRDTSERKRPKSEDGSSFAVTPSVLAASAPGVQPFVPTTPPAPTGKEEIKSSAAGSDASSAIVLDDSAAEPVAPASAAAAKVVTSEPVPETELDVKVDTVSSTKKKPVSVTLLK
eukprot:TRINITY_DN2661_c0_g1_i1.p2 TRINITY_DN2661_c0_g1~~TRINITY_DN2661_c0_g1_i1.p2  ORF type:complete len:208 (+),score=15.64 TRINITY_DN2661_c0_g1_i1:1568-2191(+)